MDLLRMDYINALPQPFVVRTLGDKDFTWQLHDICVETGYLRYIVCGLLQRSHIAEILEFKDADGNVHDSETFYSDWDE